MDAITFSFLNRNYPFAPHLTKDIAKFMINEGVVSVLEELHTAVPGWECDLYGWLVVDGNNETFVVETNHGGPFRTSISTTLERLQRHQDSYSSSITKLNTALQQKAHVTT